MLKKMALVSLFLSFQGELALAAERHTTIESFPVFEVAEFKSRPWFLDKDMGPSQLIEVLKKEGWKNIRVQSNGLYVDEEDGRTKQYQSNMRMNGSTIENFSSVIGAPNFFLTDFRISAFKDERGEETVSVKLIAPNLVVDANYKHLAHYEADVIQPALRNKYGLPNVDKGREHMQETDYAWNCSKPNVEYGICPSIKAYANHEQFRVTYYTGPLGSRALDARKAWAKKAIEEFHAAQKPNEPKL